MSNFDFMLKKYAITFPAKYQEHLTLDLKILSKTLERNKELITFWIDKFKEAVDNGSSIPNELAWIKFNDVYIALDDGGWVRR